MKHNGIIAIVFVVGCATGGVAAQLVVPPVRAGTSPTRWEYHCERVSTEGGRVTPILNQLGAEGWELVSMVSQESTTAGHGGTEGYVLCTKRALP
jgi:hypothetical protein